MYEFLGVMEDKSKIYSLSVKLLLNYQWALKQVLVSSLFLTSRYSRWLWRGQESRVLRRRIPCRSEWTTRVSELVRYRWRRHLLCLSRRLWGPRHSTHWNKQYKNYFFQSSDAKRFTWDEGHINTRMTFCRLWSLSPWCHILWLICLFKHSC